MKPNEIQEAFDHLGLGKKCMEPYEGPERFALLATQQDRDEPVPAFTTISSTTDAQIEQEDE